MFPKVSIVVPIYKVEKYLKRCVKSILNQSYSHLEVILVDDGSPDKCGEIAEHFAHKDQRVRVFHKKNGGLSDARNYGMHYVTGDYVLFVDSDDWLDSNIIEEMVKASDDFQADVVQTGFYYAYDDDDLLFDNRYHSQDDEPVVLENPKLMSELVMNKRVKNFAWGKLYKTELIKDLPFEKGVLFEDVFWAHHVMNRVQTYVMLHQPMYYYYQRNDSIVASYSPKNLDILSGLKARHQFIENFYENLVDESYKVILQTSLMHYHLLLVNRQKDKGKVHRKAIQTYIIEHDQELKKAVEEDRELSKQLRLFLIHPYFNVFFLLARKGLRKMKLFPQPAELEKIHLSERSSS